MLRSELIMVFWTCRYLKVSIETEK